MNGLYPGSLVAFNICEGSAKHKTKIHKAFSNIGCCIHGNKATILEIQGSFQIKCTNQFKLKTKIS